MGGGYDTQYMIEKHSIVLIFLSNIKRHGISERRRVKTAITKYLYLINLHI